MRRGWWAGGRLGSSLLLLQGKPFLLSSLLLLFLFCKLLFAFIFLLLFLSSGVASNLFGSCLGLLFLLGLALPFLTFSALLPCLLFLLFTFALSLGFSLLFLCDALTTLFLLTLLLLLCCFTGNFATSTLFLASLPLRFLQSCLLSLHSGLLSSLLSSFGGSLLFPDLLLKSVSIPLDFECESAERRNAHFLGFLLLVLGLLLCLSLL